MTEQTISRINAVVAVTIAALTMFSGLLGWQMGNVKNEISGAYSEAQRAELNLQKVNSTNALIANENLRAFLEYKNYFDRFNLVSQQLEQAKLADPPDEARIAELQTERNELQLLYLSKLKLFPNKFITREGVYDIEEQIGQMNAADSRRVDMNPGAHIEDAKQFEAQAGKLQSALILLAISLFLFAVASTVQTMPRWIWAGVILAGYAAAIIGVINGIVNWG